MACPHVAAVAALYITESGVKNNPDKVYRALKDSCRDLGPSNEYGHGLPNAYKVVTNAKAMEKPSVNLLNIFYRVMPRFAQFLNTLPEFSQ